MHVYPQLRHKRGFNLVQLIVIIAIVLVLLVFLFPINSHPRGGHAKVSARTCMGQLVLACDSFYENYQYLPLGKGSDIDTVRVTDEHFMAPLLGLRIAQEENPKFLTFFEFQIAKGKGEDVYDGLVRTDNRAELVGPWKNATKDQRYYRVIVDYNNDGEIHVPESLGYEIVRGKRVIAYHMGPDGKIGGKFNEDNIYSWDRWP